MADPRKLWGAMQEMKAEIIELLSDGNDGVRTSVLKFLELQVGCPIPCRNPPPWGHAGYDMTVRSHRSHVYLHQPPTTTRFWRRRCVPQGRRVSEATHQGWKQCQSGTRCSTLPSFV